MGEFLQNLGIEKNFYKYDSRDFLGGPVVKNLPSNAGDVGSIPGWGTKIPHAKRQLSLSATTIELACLDGEPTCCKLETPRTLEPAHHNQREKTHMPQLERSLSAAAREKPGCCNEEFSHASRKISCATTKTQQSQK